LGRLRRPNRRRGPASARRDRRHSPRIYSRPRHPTRKTTAAHKVYFAIFGSGLGHATRVIDIGKHLSAQDCVLRYSCSGQGFRYIRAHSPSADAVECPPLDVEWTEEGSFSGRGFMVHFPVMLRSFAEQVAFEAKSMAKFNPAVTASDSRLSAVLAARSRSYPVVTILNQFKVTLPPRFRGDLLGSLYERTAGDVLGLLWSLSDQVLLTDLPPPYTIGEANVAGTDLSRIVRYVGFTSPGVQVDEDRLRKARGVLDHDPRPLIFFQISGPDATKKRFIDIVLGSVAGLSARYKVVVSMGYLGGSGEPRKLAGGALLYDWCPIKDELFALSEVLVARSGHRTIGQCIDARKPAVLVPIHNHSEQLGNAEKFQSLGLGIAILPGDLEPGRLTEAVDSCVRDPGYKRNLESVGCISQRYRGIERCTEIIRSYA
jgi:UDP-N-acetylglucosamine--N-acetylmuramyl-(pentapeptide) pyrophosphoryl-undecaprenol N-acetylglucosamine transferase